ncbi:MAG: class I SAM-dependent methyltransferase [Candidatus Paceibacterota bacterium]|jgi:23S rRNA (cytosine1962-C5)-methyltransferase
MKKEIKIFCAEDWKDYELLDTGEGEKLERFGKYIFVRPCEDAVWSKTLTKEVQKFWQNADGKFWSSKTGAIKGWKMKSVQSSTLHKWEMGYKNVKFLASPTPFRHLGFFPEQAVHWDFIEERIGKASSGKNFFESSPSESKKIAKQQLFHGPHSNLNMVNELDEAYAEKSSVSQFFKPKFLNLFGYTGVASLFALRAGAEVTHVDASKKSTDWAKENQKLNSHLGLEKMSMRIITDDVMKFLEKEIKRGNKYDAVIMDPPKFGRGPKGEIWKIEEDLPKLLFQVRKILSDKPLFIILNSYAIDSSSLSLGYALEDAMSGLKGEISSGELCLLEKSHNRIIPLSNTAVWESL